MLPKASPTAREKVLSQVATQTPLLKGETRAGRRPRRVRGQTTSAKSRLQQVWARSAFLVESRVMKDSSALRRVSIRSSSLSAFRSLRNPIRLVRSVRLRPPVRTWTAGLRSCWIAATRIASARKGRLMGISRACTAGRSALTMKTVVAARAAMISVAYFCRGGVFPNVIHETGLQTAHVPTGRIV